MMKMTGYHFIVRFTFLKYNIFLMSNENQTAEDFLNFSHKFKLGCLLTEQPHPKTVGLSQMAQTDVKKAISAIKQLDIQTINVLQTKLDELQNLYQEVNDTLMTGGRIFICGCGATGRLSIVLQTLWRQETKQIFATDWQDRVISFMAGGDAALIKSIEDFQDHPEFAEQQLIQLGFKQNDLLIGSTEGGETWWVIGAVWKATEVSNRKPFILYGNTDDILSQNVQRSREFIESEKIRKINCNVGQMALAGSTRMQSTTILMYAIGLTLFGCDRIRKQKGINKTWRDYAGDHVTTFSQYFHKTDFSFLEAFIVHEANLYNQKQLITYQTDSYFAASILTDTTERSPTFSLVAFSNKYNPGNKPSWCNLKILHKNQKTSELKWEQQVQKDWQEMLGGREIRGLNSNYWEKYKTKVTNQIILGFGLHEKRPNSIIISHPLKFEFEVNQQKTWSFEPPALGLDCRLGQNCLLKCLLNSASTIVMGRLGRYQSNIMTYVKATNYKLIDRAARYVALLNPQFTYEQAVRAIYAIRKKIGDDEPIVLKAIEYLIQA